MRSTVHLTDRLTNAARRLGSATDYVPIRVHLPDGTQQIALMTDAPFLEGIARAATNPEDVERALAIAALREAQAERAGRSRRWAWVGLASLGVSAALMAALLWSLIA